MVHHGLAVSKHHGILAWLFVSKTMTYHGLLRYLESYSRFPPEYNLKKETRNSTGHCERGSKRERPKKMWLDNIKEWTDVPLRDLLEATHDSDQWRRVVGVASRNAPFHTL